MNKYSVCIYKFVLAYTSLFRFETSSEMITMFFVNEIYSMKH